MEEMRDAVSDHDGADGAWDGDTSTIYLRRGLATARSNEAFWHEVLHMLVDRFLDPP